MLKRVGFKLHFLEGGYLLTVVGILLSERFVPSLLNDFLRCRCNKNLLNP